MQEQLVSISDWSIVDMPLLDQHSTMIRSDPMPAIPQVISLTGSIQSQMAHSLWAALDDLRLIVRAPKC